MPKWGPGSSDTTTLLKNWRAYQAWGYRLFMSKRKFIWRVSVSRDLKSDGDDVDYSISSLYMCTHSMRRLQKQQRCIQSFVCIGIWMDLPGAGWRWKGNSNPFGKRTHPSDSLLFCISCNSCHLPIASPAFCWYMWHITWRNNLSYSSIPIIVTCMTTHTTISNQSHSLTSSYW